MNKTEHLPEPLCCDVCQGEVMYLEFPQKFGTMAAQRMIGQWKCRKANCRALVSCHPGTKRPVGYMATEKIRRLRSECHRHFDVLWTDPDARWTRQSAYLWMSQILNIPREISNISKLSEEQLKFVIEESDKLYIEHQKLLNSIRKGARKSTRDRRMLRSAKKDDAGKRHQKPNVKNYEQFI